MSDSCSDIFDKNMDVEVDKTEFLNDLFGEPVAGNLSPCPMNLQKPKDNPGCDTVINPNVSSIHPAFASYLPSVAGNGSSLDVKTPSRVFFPFYSESSDYPSSSLTTPNPNSSDGQTLSTPSSFSPPQQKNDVINMRFWLQWSPTIYAKLKDHMQMLVFLLHII